MCDSIVIVVQVFEERSDIDCDQCSFPFVLGQKTNQEGQIIARFYDRESSISPLTGAKCQVRAVTGNQFQATTSITGQSLGRVTAYKVEVNVAASIIGINHQLVNGVPRAAECAFELLRYWAAWRGITPYGLAQFLLKNVRLKSVTLTFLFPFASRVEAVERLCELRNHAQGVLNHVLRAPGSKHDKGQPPCYSVGPNNCFTLYIKQRQFKIKAYIKQPNVPEAFAIFPSPEVERELVEQALRTVRVEVTLHESWLKQNGLDDPEAWRNNPGAYETAFNLIRQTLRLDENLRVRAPTEETIAKLPPDHQTVLRAHLAGENIRNHPLVLNCTGTDDQVLYEQSKKFSALKLPILKVAAVDLSIPWPIQSTLLSPHLKNWFKYLGQFVPLDHLLEHVFSPVSAPKAVAALQARTDSVLARQSSSESVGPDEQVLDRSRSDLSDLDAVDPVAGAGPAVDRVDDAGLGDSGPAVDSGEADTDLDGLD